MDTGKILQDLALEHCPICKAGKPLFINPTPNRDPDNYKLYYHTLDAVNLDCPSSFIWFKRVQLALE